MHVVVCSGVIIVIDVFRDPATVGMDVLFGGFDFDVSGLGIVMAGVNNIQGWPCGTIAMSHVDRNHISVTDEFQLICPYILHIAVPVGIG